METWFYEVVSIDGDYANLRRTDIESDDLKLVARALLRKNNQKKGICLWCSSGRRVPLPGGTRRKHAGCDWLGKK